MTPDEQGMELKPCPFCGGDAVCSPADDSGDVVYGVACMSCQAQITKCDEAGAIQQWNLRTIPAQPSSVADDALGNHELSLGVVRRLREIEAERASSSELPKIYETDGVKPQASVADGVERVAGVIEREFYKFVDDPPLPGTKPFEHIACAAIAALQENRG